MFSRKNYFGLTPSQAQKLDSLVTKIRSGQGLIPMTVKLISNAFESMDDSSPSEDNAINIVLMGMVLKKVERSINAIFTLDDGTGQIDIIKWVNDTSDEMEIAAIRNGMDVIVMGSLNGFQDRNQIRAFSIRPIIDPDAIKHHFLECIYVHQYSIKQKVEGVSQSQTTRSMTTASSSRFKEPQAQSSAGANTNGSETDLYKQVLNVFNERASLAHDNGLHVDEVVKKLRIPIKKIREAIDYHVDKGYLYSTIDEYHFKAVIIID